MKTIIVTLTAATALAAITPAAAQTGSTARNSNMNFSTRISQLDTRLQSGISNGTIDRSEAGDLRSDISALKKLERQYRSNGLTEAETDDLQARIRDIRGDLRMADNGQSGRYASWDRDWDSEDGRNSAYTGVGGPIETGVACPVQSGIGGLISGVLGRATGSTAASDCGLDVGQRVPGNLVAVPSLFRNQYRDGNGVYYRADGQNVYQIDNGTHVVRQVFPMTR